MARQLAPVAITAWQCLTAAGVGNRSLVEAMRANRCQLGPIRLMSLPFATVVGEYPGPLPEIPSQWRAYDCRNARFALAALEADGFREQVEYACQRYGRGRVGLVLGTSTSGIHDSERAYDHFVQSGRMPADLNFIHRHAVQGTAEFLKNVLNLHGPWYAVSTACSSSAKALGSGQRLLQAGLCDAVLVAGVDTLCRMTLRGFHSLDLIAAGPCRPMDAARCGINIGEGAAMMLLERSSGPTRHHPHLLAVGESSDAHHMSAPDPEGQGAEAAMQQALKLAGITPDQVAYVNLHATATPLNDLSEAKAVARLFGDRPPCSGIKGLIGHTLGASGVVEVCATLLALQAGFLPGTCGLEQPETGLRLRLLFEPLACDPGGLALCNAFGFGGSNASVLLGLGDNQS